MTRPLKRQQSAAAQAAVEDAAKCPHFGVITIHFPAGKQPGSVQIHPWKMTADDALTVIRKLKEHFRLSGE